MLHITSILQKASNSTIQDRTAALNALTRNYSFIHDTYSDRYDFHYNSDSNNLDDYETNIKGYWGYIRDKKADRSQIAKPGQSEYDGFWGQYKDSQIDFNSKFSNQLSDKDMLKSSDSGSNSTFNYKISQLKIQARKSDEKSHKSGLL